MSAWPRGTGSAPADPTHQPHSPLCPAAIAPAPSETSALPKLREAQHTTAQSCFSDAQTLHRLTRYGVLDLRDVGKVSSVWDAEAAHAVGVPPLLQRAGNTHLSGCTDRAKLRGAEDGELTAKCLWKALGPL